MRARQDIFLRLRQVSSCWRQIHWTNNAKGDQTVTW